MSEPPNSQPPNEASEPPNLTTVDLEEVVRRRASPRRRALQIGSVALLFVVALGVVVYELTRTLAQPVTAPPPAVLVSNISFGTVALNGKTLNGPPPVVLPLREGTNRIVLDAPPFTAHSCQLTWHDGQLANIGDCPAESRDVEVSIGGRPIRPGLVVALTLSDYDLTAASVASAQKVIADTLARVHLGLVKVAPGESIATGGFFPAQVNSTTASTDLLASLSFTLPDQALGGPFPSVCSSYNEGNVMCAGMPLVAPTSEPEWSVTLIATYQWTYTDISGNVVATSMGYPFMPPVSMLLAADGAGGWTVADAPSANPTASDSYGTWAEKLCGAGASILEANTQDYQGRASVVQDNGVQGCELLARLDNGQSAQFIWRCGVLLADGALASQLVPGVPVALPGVAAQFTR